jgi:MFS family permease
MALPTRIAPAPGATTTPRASWLMLAVLLLGQFMCIIDVLVTNVAMPSIAASLHASGASLQLVVGGYTIAYAMLLITGARFGDRYGRRRTYLAGVLIFTAASLACALAPDSQALMLPLVLGREEGWPAWGFGCIAAGVALAVGFVLIERRVAARGGDPLLNLAVLRIPALPSGLITLAATQIGYGTHVPAARAADASGLLTTTVQLGQLLGVAAIGSVYLSHAGRSADAATSAAAMSGTALWLAALSAAGLLAAAVIVRAARTHRR